MLPGRLQILDERLVVHSNRLSRHRGLRDFMRAVSRLGDGIAWYLLTACLLALFGRAALPAFGHMVLAGVGGVVVYKFLKARTLRPRPFEVVSDVVCTGCPLDRFSFPSGHTLHAVSFSLILASHFPALGPAVFSFALLVAASRPVLGLHYPSDVLAGGGIGAMLAALVLLLPL
ncbi:phosphatase PAP2 family protein [Zoogloea sp.]|uniref:phosphatase PAP2 family protein n=1 Tax=Zoogloea sp. TaxID=49181 RepID=UPI0026229E6B|nr:phosphatase PAP2 family protein [Zoogloea sp.]MDD3353751.1 phosphatase PAP2 family protein [Zoogloea sp.]